MALQFTAMNGCPARGLTSWMERATSSLPVPDSPLTSTGAMLRATLSTSARTCCMAGDWPAMRFMAWLVGMAGGAASRTAARGAPAGAAPWLEGRLDGTTVGDAAGARPSAEATTARNCFRSTGFVR